MTQAKKTIKAVAVVRDIRSGMTDVALREKYRLTPTGLETVFRKLLEAGLIVPEDLQRRPQVGTDRVPEESVRIFDRKKLDLPLTIYERDNPDVRGVILDMSERGVGVRGLEASVGDVKTFVIAADEFFEVDPTEFEAVCRWVGGEGASGEPFGGYEVTDPSETGLKDLLDLMRALSLDERTVMSSHLRKSRRDHLL